MALRSLFDELVSLISLQCLTSCNCTLQPAVHFCRLLYVVLNLSITKKMYAVCLGCLANGNPVQHGVAVQYIHTTYVMPLREKQLHYTPTLFTTKCRSTSAAPGHPNPHTSATHLRFCPRRKSENSTAGGHELFVIYGCIKFININSLFTTIIPGLVHASLFIRIYIQHL